MSGHHRWSEIKHKRDSIIWTGENKVELDEFAWSSDWGYAAGSNYYNFRWYHILYSKLEVRVRWLPGWEPKDDPTVLEIYPLSTPNDRPWHWTTARIGDRIYRDGTVERKQ